MKKRILFIIIALVMVFSLTACGEKDDTEKGKARKTEKTTATPDPGTSVTPTDEPTVTPTPTDGPEPTDVPLLPVPDVYEGPDFVVARGSGCDRYSDWFTGDGPAFDSELDYIYITSYGYPELAATVRRQNLEVYQDNDRVRDSVAEMFEEITSPFSYHWYETNTVHVWRHDSVLFSYARLDDTYLGGAHPYAARKGYTINTVTGEEVDITTLIVDMNAFSNDLVLLLSSSASRDGLWDGWKDKVKEAVANGEFGWVATDDGLQVWFNNGYLAPYASGEICVDYNYESFPDRFVWEYVGAYGDFTPKEEGAGFVKYYWYSDYSEQYVEVLRNLINGLGKMAWEDLAAYLRGKNIPFEGYGDKDAASMESDAYAIFNGIDSTDRYFVGFWPEDENDYNSTQRIKNIDIRFQGYEFFLIIQLDSEGAVTYRIIDCSFPIRDSATVYDLDEAMKVMVIAMKEYYDDIRVTTVD